MKDEIDILHEYVELKGIVTKFPHGTIEEAQAVVDFANQLDGYLENAENRFELAKEALEISVFLIQVEDDKDIKDWIKIQRILEILGIREIDESVLVEERE